MSNAQHAPGPFADMFAVLAEWREKEGFEPKASVVLATAEQRYVTLAAENQRLRRAGGRAMKPLSLNGWQRLWVCHNAG